MWRQQQEVMCQQQEVMCQQQEVMCQQQEVMLRTDEIWKASCRPSPLGSGKNHLNKIKEEPYLNYENDIEDVYEKPLNLDTLDL
jgi:hypothetical protein